MEKTMEQEQLLSEYFSIPIAAPSYLVPATLRKINERRPLGMLIGAVALNLLLTLLLAVFLLAGPLLLFWKLAILMMLCLFQAIAAALLVYNIAGSTAGLQRTG